MLALYKGLAEGENKKLAESGDIFQGCVRRVFGHDRFGGVSHHQKGWCVRGRGVDQCRWCSSPWSDQWGMNRGQLGVDE